MALVKGLLVAAVGGLIGGAAWAAAGPLAGYKLGAVTCGIGALVGMAMVIGSGNRAGLGGGLLAAIVTAGAMLAGSQAGVMLGWRHAVKPVVAVLSPEDARENLGLDVLQEFKDRSKRMTATDDPEELPPEVIAERDKRWALMTQTERDEYLASLVKRGVKARPGLDRSLASLPLPQGFGKGDLAWVGLACVFACVIGSYQRTEPANVLRIEPRQGPLPRMPGSAKTRPERAAPPEPEPGANYGIFARLGNDEAGEGTSARSRVRRAA